MNAKINWGILGTGRIAGVFAGQLPKSQTGVLAAVGSRTREAAEKFGAEYQIPRRHASYQALLDDPGVDAVYISMPNDLHAEWAIRAARAGKHILCEKPFALNHAQAMAAINAARRHKVFLLEAFMYRCHPLIADVVRRIRAGEIGQVKFIEARFAYTGQPNPANCRWQNAQGGGGIMDLGCYCLSAVRLYAGAALGRDGPAEPVELKGVGHIGEHHVDEWAAATLRFDNDVLANVYASQRIGAESSVRIHGDKGRIALLNPWFPGRDGGAATYTLAVDGRDPQEISVTADVPLYAIEADVLAAHRAAGQAPSPCMTWADTLGNMAALDSWRREIGLEFAGETAASFAGPLLGLPLQARAGHPMTYGRIDGLDQPVSRLVLGTMAHVFPDLPHTAMMADHFFENGGNCFDSAYIYSGGAAEQRLGQWIRSRGVRDQVVVVTKGCTPPNCRPDAIRGQCRTSLERLGLDHVDVYLLHRDDPAIPVGEWVDALDELKREGWLRAFGGSNWSIARLAEANAYAAAHGRTGFAASSPQFSLASWNAPTWDGCATATDADSRRWYEQSGVALLAWSSQANGMLTGRFRPEDRAALGEDHQVVRTWFNDANWERLARVEQLAAAKKVSAAQITAAYVLGQPLNLFALIGPHTLDELNDALASLAVRLTVPERQWLNLEVPRPG